MKTFTRPSRPALLRRLIPLIALAAVAASLTAATAHADLAAVSPGLDPAIGFPVYFQDSAGVRLQMCLRPPARGAVKALPNPGAAAAVPRHLPTRAETPYLSAAPGFPTRTPQNTYVANLAR